MIYIFYYDSKIVTELHALFMVSYSSFITFGTKMMRRTHIKCVINMLCVTIYMIEHVLFNRLFYIKIREIN